MFEDNSVLRVEIKNSKPVELSDLANSLSALAEFYRDFANESIGDPHPDNFRLYVQEVRSGSVVADLVSLAEQAQWFVEHKEVFGAFVANLNDIVGYFLSNKDGRGEHKPTAKQAKQIAQIIEPVANDGGSQMNINVMDGGVVVIHQHHHFHLDSLQANAVQNQVGRYLGPQLPASQVLQDQLMALEQVKNDAASKTGDRGVIESISIRPVKLQFSSEEAKRKVLHLDDNPLQCVFQVTVEVRSVGGRPVLYRIMEVTDVIRPAA